MLPFTPRLFVFVSRLSQTRDNKRGVKDSMLSSRLLYDVFVSRVSQTRDNIRGVKGSMLSLRLLDHVFVSCVSQTRDNKRGVKGSIEHAILNTTFIVSGLTHTGHEHMI
jgi:hypothetical protein